MFEIIFHNRATDSECREFIDDAFEGSREWAVAACRDDEYFYMIDQETGETVASGDASGVWDE